MRELSSELGGLEVAQVFVKQKSGGYYSTIYGTKSAISIPAFDNGTPYLINHIHTMGTTVPSAADMQILQRLQSIQKANGMPIQTSSQIIPIWQPNAKFNTTGQINIQMESKLIKEKYPEIYNNPEHYGLIRGDDLSPDFAIIFKQNRGFVILEEYYKEAILFLLESGVAIYESYADMLSKIPKQSDGGHYLNND